MKLERWKHGLGSLAAILIVACTVAAQQPATAARQTIANLQRGFATPPSDARPMVRWWWFGAAVVKPEILRELQQMKADGIGGAELAFVYPEVLDDPAHNLKNLPFLSPEMLDDVRYAQSEGRKLGLRIDITLCSGWPYGGPATTQAYAATQLKTIEVAIAPSATSVSLPSRAQGDTLISASVVNGEPKHWDAATRRPLDLHTLRLDSSATRRVALFFYASHTGQQVKRAAVGAEGYVLDPFSHDAVAMHLKAVGEPLVKAFGDTPPYAIFSDSLEAYGADWTPDLPAEFLKRRGYDLIPHLPELVAGGTPEAARVRHDWGRTLTELVDENYLTQINDWATTHHTKFRSQTYGEPAVSLSSQRLVALPEGEGPQWRAFSTLRWATSANHLFGNSVTSGETFTWLHSPVFRATPLDMKAEADIDFIMGENQLIFHGWPYSPPDGEVLEPGWSLYAATSMNDHNPWHPVMPAVTTYITRLSWLLRQGKPANQVAVLLPTDDAWASFAPGKVTVTGAMQKLISKEMVANILSAGYNYDFIDADTIDRQGIGGYQILVIPPADRIPVEALRKINDWAAHDGKVIAVGKLPSLDAEGKPLTSSTQAIALVPSATQLPKALHAAAAPDLRIAPELQAKSDGIGFIRRKLSKSDIYYVVNTSNEPISGTVALQTEFADCEVWNAERGTRDEYCGASSIELKLAPYESKIFVLSPMVRNLVPFAKSHSSSTKEIDLNDDWKIAFTGNNNLPSKSALTDWTVDPTTLHYSGEAIYSRDFTLATVPHSPIYLEVDGGTPLPGAPNSPPEHEVLGANGLPNPLVTRTGPGMHAYFDPPIREAALVTINGKPAGALWHPPYRLDVTNLLKPGQNHIEIRVYNTALNAWSALPPHDYKPLIEKYGDRFQMQDLDKVKPIPSGILGTIHLVTQEP